jgi:hypothetical protein
VGEELPESVSSSVPGAAELSEYKRTEKPVGLPTALDNASVTDAN